MMTRSMRHKRLQKRRAAVLTFLAAVVLLAAGLTLFPASAKSDEPALGARAEIILPEAEPQDAPRAIALAYGSNPPVSPALNRAPAPAPIKAAMELKPAIAPSPAPENTVASGDTAASPKPVPAEAPEDELPYYLYVEKGSFTLTIYKKDEDGEYADVYKTYRISHGGNKTPAGKFELGKKERWHEFGDGGFVQYATTYHKRLFVHSPLYGSENAKHLWPAYYDGSHGIGKASTGGCLRMVTEAARFIYEECPEGTVLEIVNGSPKNTTSDDPPDRDHKRYDPTDVNVDAD